MTASRRNTASAASEHLGVHGERGVDRLVHMKDGVGLLDTGRSQSTPERRRAASWTRLLPRAFTCPLRHRKPVTPFRALSGTPPSATATTGNPCAIASATTRPNGFRAAGLMRASTTGVEAQYVSLKFNERHILLQAPAAHKSQQLVEALSVLRPEFRRAGHKQAGAWHLGGQDLECRDRIVHALPQGGLTDKPYDKRGLRDTRRLGHPDTHGLRIDDHNRSAEAGDESKWLSRPCHPGGSHGKD